MPGAEYVYGIIKDMTPAEELAYWRGRTEALRREQSALRLKVGAAAAGQGKT